LTERGADGKTHHEHEKKTSTLNQHGWPVEPTSVRALSAYSEAERWQAAGAFAFASGPGVAKSAKSKFVVYYITSRYHSVHPLSDARWMV